MSADHAVFFFAFVLLLLSLSTGHAGYHHSIISILYQQPTIHGTIHCDIAISWLHDQSIDMFLLFLILLLQLLMSYRLMVTDSGDQVDGSIYFAKLVTIIPNEESWAIPKYNDQLTRSTERRNQLNVELQCQRLVKWRSFN